MVESNIGQDITGEVLNTIRKSQAAIVDAIERWAGTVQSMRPELPELPFADSLNIADSMSPCALRKWLFATGSARIARSLRRSWNSG